MHSYLQVIFKNIESFCSAVRNGHLEVVKFLLQKGADIEIPNDNGWYPTPLAIHSGYSEIAKLLIFAGADLNAGKGTGTCLSLALEVLDNSKKFLTPISVRTLKLQNCWWNVVPM
jgi:ankyrin repeat protein